MTTASPTPMSASSLPHTTRTLHARSRLPSHSYSSRRPVASLRQAPFPSLGDSHGFMANAAPLQDISIGDSSEDEAPPPMVAFSAQTRAILEDQPLGSAAISAEIQKQEIASTTYGLATMQAGNTQDQATPSRERLRISRRATPSPTTDGRPLRVVRISPRQASPELSSREHSLSHNRFTNQQETHEHITPGPELRSARGFHSGRPGSVSSSASRSANTSSRRASLTKDEHEAPAEQAQQISEDHQTTHDSEMNHQNRTRAVTEVVPNSMRVKRVPTTGSFLRGAPMRRGARRRQSEDEQSPVEDANMQHQLADGNSYQSGQDDNHKRQEEAPIVGRDFALNTGQLPASAARAQTHRTTSDGLSIEKQAMAGGEPSIAKRRTSPILQDRQLQAQSSSQGRNHAPIAYRVPSGALDSTHDQENDPPPTFRRKKLITGIGGDNMEAFESAKPARMLADASNSPGRPALAPLDRNTPARNAPPPPPKMSVLETATANAGSSTVKSKRKRSHVTVNGKVFALRGRLGKGGSSDVWRVMAENDKMFALKKVNLADCNEEAVRSFKGEIDLLKKLEDNDRVVRLYDYEVNEQKQQLSVLMEMGESDLNRVLSGRILPEDARLDLAFTRFYWREMLECVAAVHGHDIVHSDLKPPNFLLVQGRLKLIDFGIADAIDIDHTVNVHRDTNVGTPNYMSPESLQDSNDGKRAPGQPKLMKLGKPSDVWSLGCILYQMTYGKPPFGHITNQWNRVMAIVNPEVQIQYPLQGVGGVLVPPSLRSLLRRCLNRDSRQRPTVAQLLDSSEPFLHPDNQQPQFDDNRVPMTEDMLAQILRNVINRCKDPKRGIPSEAELRAYPKGFLDRIRASLDKA